MLSYDWVTVTAAYYYCAQTEQGSQDQIALLFRIYVTLSLNDFIPTKKHASFAFLLTYVFIRQSLGLTVVTAQLNLNSTSTRVGVTT